MPIEVFSPIQTAFNILATYWWLYLPVILVGTVIGGWRHYIKEKFIRNQKWILLEIKPPADVEKSPKIAESIFAGLHGTYFKISPKKQFFFGDIPTWFSFEISGTAGEMHFYVRTVESMRNLVEAEIFGQYPDAEIRIAEDYTHALPMYIPDDEYEMFGTELIFAKENCYPIKTYMAFEEKLSKGDSRLIDPLAPLAEVIGSLQPGEHIWLQYLVKPTGDDWVKAAQPVLDKLMGKVSKSNDSLFLKLLTGVFHIFTGLMQFIFDALSGPATPAVPVKEEKPPEFSMAKLSTGQKNVLEAIENKLSKLGFKVGIRLLYIARKERFDKSRVPGVTGMFKQLYANNMNTFKANPRGITISRGYLHQIFPSDRGFGAAKEEYKRKWKMYIKYKKRALASQTVILCTEELATLWHLPGLEVQAPSVSRVESKKGDPPLTLPR